VQRALLADLDAGKLHGVGGRLQLHLMCASSSAAQGGAGLELRTDAGLAAATARAPEPDRCCACRRCADYAEDVPELLTLIRRPARRDEHLGFAASGSPRRRLRNSLGRATSRS